MKERSINFSGPEVRALLDGRKTQARRLVHPNMQWVPHLHTARQPDGVRSFYVSSPDGTGLPLRLTHAPAYPGERLWVREAWALEELGEDGQRLVWRIDRAARWVADGETIHYLESDYEPACWRSPLFMPRWASRITLEVTSVRVQRLQSISEEDARAEGVVPVFERYPAMGRDQRTTTGDLMAAAPHRAAFAMLWDEINGDRASWLDNPWTWVLEFKRVNQEAKAA
ncbi:hypothetical protein [Sorangium sp. So ce233]|uniref:hypothetical protein n=1 Tax=Sorangium sp. So ce233 TaxID=3133290 RepID=UPI003F60BD86